MNQVIKFSYIRKLTTKYYIILNVNNFYKIQEADRFLKQHKYKGNK